MEHARRLINRLLEEESLLFVVFGDARQKSLPCKKVTLRPVMIKEELAYQAEYHFQDKVTHENMESGEAETLLSAYFLLNLNNLTSLPRMGITHS